MPKFELERVGFVNPSTNTENVSLSTILEGSPGATRTFVEEESEGYVSEDNQEIKDGQIFTLTMAGKESGQTQLSTWADNHTKLSISGYAYDKFLFIDNAYLTGRINANERKVWELGARKAGAIGYTDGKLDTEFMMSENGLNMYYWEEGTTNMAAGWEKSGGTTLWSSGTLQFTTTGATKLHLYRDLYFPFEKQVTFFVDVTAITVTTGITVGIVAYDESGAEIGSESTQAVSSTGVESVTRTLPSGTVKVRVRVSIGQDDSITIQDPGLNLGTTTNYISQ